VRRFDGTEKGGNPRIYNCVEFLVVERWNGEVQDIAGLWAETAEETVEEDGAQYAFKNIV